MWPFMRGPLLGLRELPMEAALLRSDWSAENGFSSSGRTSEGMEPCMGPDERIAALEWACPLDVAALICSTGMDQEWHS